MADIAIHLLDAIEEGEQRFHAGESHLGPEGDTADEPDDGPLSPVAGS